MELILVNIIDGLVTGLLLFMLSAGLTLIFSMMGVLNFAHASFYMLGAYFAYQISIALGFWMGLLIAPIIVGVMGAGVERYGLRRVHQYGHVPELIFTFGLALLIEELVQFIWGKNQMAYSIPEVLNFTAFSIAGNSIPAYKIFMIFISVAIFIGLLYILTRTRVGMIIQAALSYPRTVETLGFNAVGIATPENLSDHWLRDLWTVTSPQIADILPYILMVLILIFRPAGLFGKRHS